MKGCRDHAIGRHGNGNLDYRFAGRGARISASTVRKLAKPLHFYHEGEYGAGAV